MTYRKLQLPTWIDPQERWVVVWAETPKGLKDDAPAEYAGVFGGPFDCETVCHACWLEASGNPSFTPAAQRAKPEPALSQLRPPPQPSARKPRRPRA